MIQKDQEIGLNDALDFQIVGYPAVECDFNESWDDLEITERKLPHWKKNGVYYHLVYRLYDSIPKASALQIKEERQQWLKKHHAPLSRQEIREYYKLFSDRMDALLGAGFGACYLADKENSSIVASSLLSFHHQRYVLDEWVVMPNHIHVIIKPMDNYTLTAILRSWKSFTAHEINKRINKNGQIWTHESYDHIIRSESSLNRTREYIRNNPGSANIKVWHSSEIVGQK